jgi:tRNA nucleotidyltransferase (CCA-adding enzyme)
MEKLLSICEAVRAAGGTPLFVGGCVRDKIMGVTPKDYDVEVYGLAPEKLTEVLRTFGNVNTVGASFGVIKLHTPEGDWLDFSIPRRENKQGKGHKGFIVEPDPTMTPKEAASRRDFTMNSLAENPFTGEIYDFFGGVADIDNGILRPTSEAFKEDPLRVLRGMQFAARFSMLPSMYTGFYAEEMISEYKDIAIERVWGEWQKLCEKGKDISRGMMFLYHTGWINLYPELKALWGVNQDPEWHPEGDAFVHTCMVADAAVEIADRENLHGDDRSVLILAAICHDLGKANTTVFKDGRWRSPGHDVSGVPLAEKFLLSIGTPYTIIARVLPLVRWHMAHILNSVSSKFVRKLSLSVQPATIKELLWVIESDMNGRPPLPGGLPPKAAEIGRLAELQGVTAKPVEKLLLGRHLMEFGLTPSPLFGKILSRAFDAQVAGEFSDVEGAKKWLSLQQLTD